jgi:hypothetical protein
MMTVAFLIKYMQYLRNPMLQLTKNDRKNTIDYKYKTDIYIHIFKHK